MSEEQPKDYTALVEKINRELRELETTLNDQQHALLTRLFAERGVLTAMRTYPNTSAANNDRPSQA
ncbi:MAG: hypothetical protein HXX08_08335 [Chloroflexi bacterium]|uniref:Uncharacterized protein n=1 Tax=Candidatus Chlorohelix allophototropha TaxID=3003348 RepID=A0A8T7M208_9CHLR|nr:hypothetical protein [Chloroflexota bacterium]WJW67735.1 hypothetical protein OZ401_001010 [Chloroflexota bacterium L227-S17]